MFDGLYHPFMVIRGMVYYYSTNINVCVCACESYLMRLSDPASSGSLGILEGPAIAVFARLMAPGREKVCHRSDIVLSSRAIHDWPFFKVHHPGD